MQQPYGNYPPYYGQPMYPHTPYMGGTGPPGPSSGYPPFYGPPNPQQPAPAPQTGNPPAPSPYSFDAAAYAVKPNQPLAEAPSRRHRRNQTTPATAPTAPLKSAMKKTMTVFNTAEATLNRQFSNPFSQQHQQNQAPPFPRPRVQSNPTKPQIAKEPSHDLEPSFHMILSFHNFNELHIEHIMQMGLEEMRKVIWPVWPDGIESDVITGHTCIVKFRNTPWDLNGPNVRHSYRLIIDIFSLFQTRGYSFQTAVNIATSAPRLIFQVTQPAVAEFFLAFFSQDGRKLTLINPPNRVDISMGAHLRSALLNNNVSDKVIDDDTRVIEVKRKFINASEIESSVVFVEVLKILNNLGFQLDAALALVRKGTLGMRSTRELLVFKGNMTALK